MSHTTTTPQGANDANDAGVAESDGSANPHRYTAAMASAIETRWQQVWESDSTFAAANPDDDNFDETKPKFFCMDMFPYPSGAGLHVGHPEGYTATDIVCRFKRACGYNVLHPMGWDAFGLPAEQYAVQTGIHPATTTSSAIKTFRGQLKRFGFSYDWSRQFATIDEDYYRWTQWIWLKAYHAWYDTTQNRARPISELTQDLENGHAYVGPSLELVQPGSSGSIEALSGKPIGMRKWHELTEADRRTFIDNQRLAYLDEQTVNWCPKLGTALANEEVIDGRSERGGYRVYRKPLRQWMFRITAYAERLLADLEDLDWPQSTRTMQQQWIGRSEGAQIDFTLADNGGALRVYTTRPDTIFGATYMVLAPEHPMVDEILQTAEGAKRAAEVRGYVEAAARRTDVDRMAETKEKTGVFTGHYAINPATRKRVPIWIADYVLMGYGHGAIMAVPGQDQRDWEFATVYDLPIVRTVEPPSDFAGQAFAGDGPAINSEFLDGLSIIDAKSRIIAWLDEQGCGRAIVNYKLRDWLFSRQRYWGEPFPVVHGDDGNHYPVDFAALPVQLPKLEDFQPTESDQPAPLLAKATDWVNTTAGEAGVSADVLAPDTPVRRETNTMPNWAGSCWYYLRFCDPHVSERFTSRNAEEYWMGGAEDTGVDLYIGGAEHAVLHLLYARFWHKILYDLGEVSTTEPFRRLFHQGMITSKAYKDSTGRAVPIDEVEQRDDKFYLIETGEEVEQIVAKMSKTLKNVVNPDDIIREFGADTFRLYEMYLGPLEAMKPWNTRDMIGPFRFLQRAWRLAVDEQTGELAAVDTPHGDVERQLHKTIAKVEVDIDRLAFNTAIAAMIEFVNTATAHGGLTRDQIERFTLVLAPFAPHIGEELWSKLGNDTTLAYEPWPKFDPSMLLDDTIELPVQIKGKVRAHITVPADADAARIEQIALADDAVRQALQGKPPRKVIVVPGKIVNIVPGA